MRLPATWNPHPSSHRINRIAKMVQSISVTPGPEVLATGCERQPSGPELADLHPTPECSHLELRVFEAASTESFPNAS